MAVAPVVVYEHCIFSHEGHSSQGQKGNNITVDVDIDRAGNRPMQPSKRPMPTRDDPKPRVPFYVTWGTRAKTVFSFDPTHPGESLPL